MSPKPRKQIKRLVTLNLRTSRKGIRQVLGDLEADIMELLWKNSPVTVRDVHTKLAKKRTIAYTTVMTVMSRLAEKGLLKREHRGRAYLYSPTQNREEFCSDAISTVMTGLLGGFGEPVLSHFVDTIGSEDRENLDELIRLIETKKKNEEKSAT